MCEFKVILEDGNEKKVVAKGVVKAKLKDGKVTLMDVAGVVARVEGASIVTVDTMMAELVLRFDDGQKASATESPVLTSEADAHGGPLPEDLAALKRFHGHLGPYVVLGMRMGHYARERFPNRIYATLLSGTNRPLSCLADGVQFASCCTVGKANLSIREGGKAAAMFTDGTTAFKLIVRQEILERIEGMTGEDEDRMSLGLFQESALRLFARTPATPSDAWGD